MWSVDDRWRAARLGDQAMSCTVWPVMRGQVLTSEPLEIVDGSLSVELRSGQVQTSLELSIADPDGSLFTGRPDAALAVYGHRLQLRAGYAGVGDVPLGEFRVERVVPDGSPWRLHPSGRWMRGAQVLRVSAGDLLGIVADDRFTVPTQPRGGTVRVEVQRLVADVLPVGGWDAPQSVPSSVEYSESRMDALLSVMRLAGLVAVVDRAGVLQGVPDTGSGQVWEASAADVVEWVPVMDRDGLRNGWVVTSESESGEPLRGAEFERSGPLAWDASGFGRVPEFLHSPLMRTNAQCAVAAQTMAAKARAARRQTLTVTCAPDPALDVLDTLRLRLPTRTIDALITGIRMPLVDGLMQLTASAGWGVLTDV
ncbi:hypothetical protein ACWJWH_17605 [Clostridioides difficile]|uniref:hypothetical protein n=4 Tax=Bacteria TaxID=2 RepID=UPI003F98659E